jgi:hypothetical protein
MSEESLIETLQETNQLLTALINNEPGFWHFSVWLSPLAILISAGVAILSARKSISAQRQIARKRASLDLLLKLESDAEFIKATEIYRDVRDGKGLESLIIQKEGKSKSKRDEHEEFYVDHYLNTLELVCVGMSAGTIDELYIYQYMRGAIVNAWKSSEKYIIKSRGEKNRRLLEKLEDFGINWDNHTFITRKDNAKDYYEKNIHNGDDQTK